MCLPWKKKSMYNVQGCEIKNTLKYVSIPFLLRKSNGGKAKER